MKQSVNSCFCFCFVLSYLVLCVFVSLGFFVLEFWSFSSHSRIFHSFRDVTIAGEGLQNLKYARQFDH